MKALTLIVRPRGAALAIGGHSSPRHGGDHATARDAHGRPIIPATALRGALRLELERLLRGLEPPVEVCGLGRPDGDDTRCSCPVCRLFGRSGSDAGALRLSDAVLVDGPGAEGAAGVEVRSRVSIGRQRRAAVDQLLGFVETTPVLGSADAGTGPRAELHAAAWLVPAPGREGDEELKNLRAACAALSALGGSKARGLGWVRCEVVERAAGPVPERGSAGSSPPAGRTLRFEALEPLHFGCGPPLGYFQPTRSHAPGSTVRGAVAFALLEHGLVEDGADPVFQRLVTRASFGSARTRGDRPSATRRHCRPRGPQAQRHVSDDLIAELLRRLAAEAGVGLVDSPDLEHICPEPGCRAVKMVPEPYAGNAARPRVRVRTRTALNRRSGTSMDARLFSHEVLEPWTTTAEDEGAAPEPLVLTAEAWGLDGDSAALLDRLDGRRVWLGGKKSQGMGGCRLRVAAARVADGEAARARAAVDALETRLADGWAELARAVGSDLRPLLGGAGRPVALVLAEPWLPSADAAGPALEAGPLGSEPGVDLLGSFVRLAEEGRFAALEARRYGAADEFGGEETPRTVVDAGSVFVYVVQEETLDRRLDAWLRDAREGCGERRGEGWGRFVIRGPEREF